jgi:hypothetical protein
MNYYIEVFRNLNGLFTSVFSIYAVYEYTFHHNSSYLEKNSWIILVNLLVDSTMTTSPVLILHHAISFGYIVLYTHNILNPMQNTILFSNEICTMYLCVGELYRLHMTSKKEFFVDLFSIVSLFLFRPSFKIL